MTAKTPRKPSARKITVPMKDLTPLEEISQRMAERTAANDLDRLARDKLIVAARQSNFTWARISAASLLSGLATESAAKRGNDGVLPKPQNRA